MGCALSRSNPSRVSCFYINTSHSPDKTTTHTMLERDRDREGREGNWWHMWCLLRRSWTGIMWARLRSVWFASVRRSSPQFGSARFDSGLASCCLVNWRCPALRLPHDDDAASLICINKHIIYILLHTHTHTHTQIPYIYLWYLCAYCISIRRVSATTTGTHAKHSYSFICFNVEWAPHSQTQPQPGRSNPMRSDPIPIPISIPILFLNVSDCDCDSPFRIARLVVVACLELGVIRRQALGP